MKKIIGGLILLSSTSIYAICGLVVGLQTVTKEKKVIIQLKTTSQARESKILNYNISINDTLKSEKIAIAIASRSFGNQLCFAGNDLLLK